MTPDQHLIDTKRRGASLIEHERMLRTQREVAERERLSICARCAKGEHGELVCCRPWSCMCGCAK